MNRYLENNWRIDKRIPLSVIVALFFQFAGTLVWATQLDARVANVEQLSVNNGMLNERFARLEERLENVKQDTNILKQLMGRVAERLVP